MDNPGDALGFMVRGVLVRRVTGGIEFLLCDVGEFRYGEVVRNGGEDDDGSKEE